MILCLALLLKKKRPIVIEHIYRFWNEILKQGKIDVAKKSLDAAKHKARQMIDIATVEHTDARDVGTENICLQAIRQLEIDKLLRTEGWSEKQFNTTSYQTNLVDI